MARRLGASDEALAAVEHGRHDALEPAWRVALEYADAITPTRGVPDDATFARLAAHWSAPQIVEITAVVCLFNYFNRFAEALRIPPTR